MKMSLADLVDLRDYKVLYDWDHTAMLSSLIDLSIIMNIRIHTKQKPKIRSFREFHPYRDKTKEGVLITKDNLHLLKALVLRR